MFLTVLLRPIFRQHLEGQAVATYCQMFSQYKTVKKSAVPGAEPEFFTVGRGGDGPQPTCNLCLILKIRL